MALLSANKRLPPLPTETHAHVLSYCDDQTLGRACLVSLAFLELAGPRLYERVTITGFAQLERIFYNEVRISSAPHLDRFLSLDQTLSFTFLGVPADVARAYPVSQQEGLLKLFYPKRTSCSFPVEVETLDVSVPNLRANPGGQEDDLSAAIAHSVYRLFSPIDAALASTSVPDVDSLIVYLDDAPWTRLRTISLNQINISGHMSELLFFDALPSGCLTITFDLAHGHEMSDYLAYCLVGDLCATWEGDARTELLSPSWPQVKEVVVKVNSNDEKEWIVDCLRDDWDHHVQLSPAERDRREAMIRYVVV